MSTEPASSRGGLRAWSWLPTLYFAEGVPYMVVCAVSVVMLKSLGMSNSAVAFWTSWLSLPWILKPLWTPLVDIVGTKRLWIVATQSGMAVLFALAAFALPLACATQALLALFLVMAFFSATHDAAADGFYMIGLDTHAQAEFSGVRSAFYRCATIAAMGGLVMLAGLVESNTGLKPSRAHLMVGVGSTSAPDVYTPLPAKGNGPDIICHVQGDPRVAGDGRWEPAAFKTLEEAVAKWNAGDASLDPAKVPTPSGAVLLHVELAKAPAEGRPTLVSIVRKAGGGSVSVVEGERLRFDKAGQKFYALVKVDPKSKRPVDVVFELRSGNVRLAWLLCMALVAGLFALFSCYHFLALPKVESPAAAVGSRAFAIEAAFGAFVDAFVSFFRKRGVWLILAYILLYRFAESQLLKVFALFMLDGRSAGGLGLGVGEQGFIYGTVGVLFLMLGGIVGGLAIARHGLGRWLLPMCLAMNLPDLLFVYLSQALPEGLLPVGICVALEQLGYGFGFTAFMLVMAQFAEDSGRYKTSHYAIMTGFMALGMMIPGMFSGAIQAALGYKSFFLWVLVCVVPSVLVTLLAKRVVRASFGLKGQDA